MADIASPLLEEIEALLGKVDVGTFVEAGPAFCRCVKELQLALRRAEAPLVVDAMAAALLDGLWEQLNVGSWKTVPVILRTVFSYASLVRAYAALIGGDETRAISILDRGLILGAPLGDGSQPNWLSYAAGRAHGRWQIPAELEVIVQQLETAEAAVKDVKSAMRDVATGSVGAGMADVDQATLPSVAEFVGLVAAKRPLKILRLMDGWQATTRWSVRHFLEVFGRRTVPIEVGSRYTDVEWSQKLVTLETFVRDYLQPEDINKTGYLAQYGLLEQVPELLADILIPDYCYVLSDAEPEINFWFGGRTTSPLHFDKRDNILTQVFGTKLVLLYGAEESANLYPFEDALLHNTSRADPECPHDMRYPNFARAKGLRTILRPGEALYIPKGCWHFVKSLSPTSCSISFWFS